MNVVAEFQQTQSRHGVTLDCSAYLKTTECGSLRAQTVTAGTQVPPNLVNIDPLTNRITGAPYSYDAAGNLTNDGLNALTYDGESRVASSASGGVTTNYSYDGNGLRVRKCTPNCTSPTSTTVYIFSGTKVIAEYENGAAPAAPTREYIYSGAQLLATLEGSAVKYQISDHLSARVITDSSGIVVGQRAHYPFGEQWYATGSSTKWQFTSYERDAESGNDFAMARYYVNRLGRFSSPDTIAGDIADPQSLNRYAYVVNDPVNLVDPLGLCFCALRDSGTERGYEWECYFCHYGPDGFIVEYDFPQGPGFGGDAPAPQPPQQNIGQGFLQCAAEHYGLAGLLGRGALAAGSVPIKKELLNIPRGLGGASDYTNLVSALGHWLFPRGARVGTRILATTRAFGIAGRAIPYLGAAVLAYDAISISACVAR